MTNSRSSRFRRSNWLAWFAAVGLALVLFSTSAEAGRRRRIVVLDFEGPKAETFHAGVVKLIKRTHTVVSLEVWSRVADELNASKLTEKNIKKVARKLKVDGIVTGEIEKRRDEYLIRLKLKAGTSGELVGRRIDTKASGAKLDTKAQRDLKEELVAAIDELEINRSADDVADDEKSGADADVKSKKTRSDTVELMDDSDVREPALKPGRKSVGRDSKGATDDVEDRDAVKVEEAPATANKRKSADAVTVEEAPAKATKRKSPAKLSVEIVDDEEVPPPTKKLKEPSEDDGNADSKARSRKDREQPKVDGPDDTPDTAGETIVKQRNASSDRSTRAQGDDDQRESVRSKAATVPPNIEVLTPANRAIDVVAGASFSLRRLQFDADGDLADAPPAYRQSTPVAGGLIDIVVFPLAFGNARTGLLAGLGLEFMYDRVLYIRSQKKYLDDAMQQQTADLRTTQDRYSVGLVLRYPISQRFVMGGKAHYSSQRFDIAQQLPNGDPTDVPSVGYSMIEPKLFLHFLPGRSLSLNAEAGLMVVSKSGGIERPMTGYGATSTSGLEVSVGLDYNVTKNIFVRVLGRLSRFSLTFDGDPNSLSNTRDRDQMQDVRGATDLYLGGIATLGYAY